MINKLLLIALLSLSGMACAMQSNQETPSKPIETVTEDVTYNNLFDFCKAFSYFYHNWRGKDYMNPRPFGVGPYFKLYSSCLGLTTAKSHMKRAIEECHERNRHSWIKRTEDCANVRVYPYDDRFFANTIVAETLAAVKETANGDPQLGIRFPLRYTGPTEPGIAPSTAEGLLKIIKWRAGRPRM